MSTSVTSATLQRPVLGDRADIEAFLIHEAMLLDDRRFAEWRDLFTEDGHYWVPLRPGQESPLSEASLFYDDRATMETRFARLAHPRIHAQSPPHRTCHLVGSIAVQEIDPARGECQVRSSLIMVDYRVNVQRVFAGHVRHCLRREAESYRIASKRVDLINCDDAFELIAAPL
jgi:3-phenylpropionate/cinnamic acid dioxygenase small subunit